MENIRLIDADKLIQDGYDVIVDGLQYGSCNKSIDIDEVELFDLEAHDNEVRTDFANSIRNYLSDIENKIVEERNKPQSSADKIRLVSMQTCVEDFLSWLNDNTI